ncbi:MAG: DUF5063 domain-containing protein [Gammaproteobacteria bacterium]
MSTPDPKVSEMAAVARDYCDLIDHFHGGSSLERVAHLLPRLHAAIVRLDAPPVKYNYYPLPDYDVRFDLFSRLRRSLGKWDSYWLEFDADHVGPQMSGSLADDLTDIYFDLKYGLSLWDKRQPEKAWGLWSSSFHLHWGQHLVDAERHLYSLAARHQMNGAGNW